MPKGKRKGVALVAGASSRLGYRLSEALTNSGTETRAIVMPRQLREETERLPEGVEPYSIDITHNDRETASALEDACSGIDVIYLLNHPRFEIPPDYKKCLVVNVESADNVISASIAANPNSKVRVVYPSTVSVYGSSRPNLKLDETAKPRPVSDYAKSKLLAERDIAALCGKSKGHTFTILRLGAIYGCEYNDAIFRLFELLKSGSLKYHVAFSHHMSLIHVLDAVKCLQLVAKSDKAANQLYNLTDGNDYSMDELVHCSAKALHVPVAHNPEPKILDYIRDVFGIDYDDFEFMSANRIISSEKIKRELGFEPSINLEKGIRMLADDFLKKKK